MCAAGSRYHFKRAIGINERSTVRIFDRTVLLLDLVLLVLVLVPVLVLLVLVLPLVLPLLRTKNAERWRQVCLGYQYDRKDA
jgi:hypothetical protein